MKFNRNLERNRNVKKRRVLSFENGSKWGEASCSERTRRQSIRISEIKGRRRIFRVKSLLKKCIIIISIIRKAKINSQRMFYYALPTTTDPTSNLLLYFVTENFGLSLPGNSYYLPLPTNPLSFYFANPLDHKTQSSAPYESHQNLASLKVELSQTVEVAFESRPVEKPLLSANKPVYRKCQKLGIQEIKLDFRTQWKNQNRNIVPNLVNQMMSFLLKKNKSQRLIGKLFSYYSHDSSWTATKFYHYMKKIKDSISHYINESVIQYFFQIHEPKCEIYQEEEQQFYMKVCRIAILTFLRSDAIIISLTSTRMSEAKRKTHLIARQALLKKFLQLACL